MSVTIGSAVIALKNSIRRKSARHIWRSIGETKSLTNVRTMAAIVLLKHAKILKIIIWVRKALINRFWSLSFLIPVHSNERPFPCHYCPQTFKSSSNRSKHERRIHPEERKASKQLADNGEGRENGNQSTSKENIKKESIKAPANTATPVVKTKKETSLVDFDGDRLFRCDFEGCASSFRTRSSLKDHQKVHSDERWN